MPKGLIIAIDGPAGSGKSTTAKRIAERLNYLYIDTGAMYRAVTLLAIKNGVLNNDEAIISIARDSEIVLDFKDGKTFVSINSTDVTNEIRSSEVNSHVSPVSKIEGVRKALVEKQQKMGKVGSGVVMEGRDIGTVVFPEADVKIFLTCSIDERASRRSKEFSEEGKSVLVSEIKNNLSQRDLIDSTRKISPLRKAAEAIEVDTSDITIDQQVNIIIDQIIKVAKQKNIELKNL